MVETDYLPVMQGPDMLEQDLREAYFETLKSARIDTLETLLTVGKPPTYGSLCGKEFDGFNAGALAQSFIGKIIGISKFRKMFYAEGNELKGCNVRIEQDSLDEPWTPLRKNGKIIKMGYFDVIFNCLEETTILDYRNDPRNGLFDGKLLKDRLVATDSGLLVGKADMMLKDKVLATSYFVLKERREL